MLIRKDNKSVNSLVEYYVLWTKPNRILIEL